VPHGADYEDRATARRQPDAQRILRESAPRKLRIRVAGYRGRAGGGRPCMRSRILRTLPSVCGRLGRPIAFAAVFGLPGGAARDECR